MQRIPVRLTWTFTLLGAAAVTFSTAASAQETATASTAWHVALGGGIDVRPEFPGSDSTELRLLPVVDISFADRWFFNSAGLGAYVVRNEQWLLSASIAPDLTRRDESAAAYLRGTGDIDRTAVAMLSGGYSLGPIKTTLAISTDIANAGHGTVVDLAVQARWNIAPRLSLDYGIAARWANREYVETFFGVDAAQSERSGLSVYRADGGISDARLFVNATYVLNPRWIISAGGAIAQLQGDARDSPITADRDYAKVNAVILYRF